MHITTGSAGMTDATGHRPRSALKSILEAMRSEFRALMLARNKRRTARALRRLPTVVQQDVIELDRPQDQY